MPVNCQATTHRSAHDFPREAPATVNDHSFLPNIQAPTYIGTTAQTNKLFVSRHHQTLAIILSRRTICGQRFATHSGGGGGGGCGQRLATQRSALASASAMGIAKIEVAIKVSRMMMRILGCSVGTISRVWGLKCRDDFWVSESAEVYISNFEGKSSSKKC